MSHVLQIGPMTDGTQSFEICCVGCSTVRNGVDYNESHCLGVRICPMKEPLNAIVQSIPALVPSDHPMRRHMINVGVNFDDAEVLWDTEQLREVGHEKRAEGW